MNEEIVHYKIMIDSINERLYDLSISQEEFESLLRLKEDLMKGIGI